MNRESETERLRAVLTRAAEDISPSPLPLAAIERAGRTRRRVRTAGTAIGSAVLVTPVIAVAMHLGSALPSPWHRHGNPPAATGNGATGVPAARVVAAGERVDVGPGLSVWLTGKGKYVSSPSEGTQFTPKVDGDQTGGVNLQAGQVSGKWFVSGVYLGQGTASRVEFRTVDGRVVAGHVLQLAGDRTWGSSTSTRARSCRSHRTPSPVWASPR